MNFQRPLGLALAGGGSHGAWQAGCLKALTDAGLAFDKVLGFSAGALTGAGYCLDREDELSIHWNAIDGDRILRFAPTLRPPTMFSRDGVVKAIAYTLDDENARRRARCELTVVSLRARDRRYDYARFTPEGRTGWDGPLATKLLASCAIPGVFPPVETEIDGELHVLVDGGVPGEDWMRFDALAGCRDVIVLQMVRPEELGRWRFFPWWRFDQTGREVVHRQMTSGIESLRARAEPPRVFRVFPSRVLEFSMLSFRAQYTAPALVHGGEDGRIFLQSPERFLEGPAPAETTIPSAPTLAPAPTP